MQHIILISKRCKVWKVSDNYFSVAVMITKETKQIKTFSSSARRVLLSMFYPLSIFMVICQRFYYPPCAVQLLNETTRQVELGADLRTITVIQGSKEDLCQWRAPIREDWALNVTANWTWGCPACYELNGKTWARHCLGNFLFFCEQVCVNVCAPRPSILSDMFNRALAALTEGVNVSYFIRNPKEEG